jgi:hypothetical protein
MLSLNLVEAHHSLSCEDFCISTDASENRQLPELALFGTDEVAPSTQKQYLRVYYQYDPLWQLLTPVAREKVTKGNYERIFDEARNKVRAWEAANVK